MNFTDFQPLYIKFNNNEELPINVRGKYFIYYYFSVFDNSNSIPAMYVKLDSANKLFDFIKEISSSDRETFNTVLQTGTDDFKINEDYYINKSLYGCIVEHFADGFEYLPDYILNYNINDTYFEVNSDDTIYKYLVYKNNLIGKTFTETELKNFYSTFCKLILNNTSYISVTTQDKIYEKVLKYFSNFQYDETSVGLQLILTNKYGQNNNSILSCNCNTVGSSSTDICATSCVYYYASAMKEYLKSMLGNSDFYNNWFFVTVDGQTFINSNLIDEIKTLIKQFLELKLNINTEKPSSILPECVCPSLDNTSDSCNRSIINNYLKVLDYIETNTIDENKNKIKVYGETFGELLPKLIF